MELKLVDLGGPVHYADFGGTGEPMVLVHGLGGAYTNWLAVGDALSRRCHVFALDLAGFGRTPPLAGRKASIADNAALVTRFIERVSGGPAVVVGHSMGGAIAAQVSAERPDLVSRLILLNAVLLRSPSTPIDPGVTTVLGLWMTPVLGKLLFSWMVTKTSPERSVARTLAACGIDVANVPAELLAPSVALANDRRQMPWAHDAIVTATRSLTALTVRRRRVQAMLESIKAPTLLIHGTRDRLAPFSTAQDVARIRPDWSLAVLEGVGHAPQIEVPERYLEAVTRWLTSSAG